MTWACANVDMLPRLGASFPPSKASTCCARRNSNLLVNKVDLTVGIPRQIHKGAPAPRLHGSRRSSHCERQEASRLPNPAKKLVPQVVPGRRSKKSRRASAAEAAAGGEALVGQSRRRRIDLGSKVRPDRNSSRSFAPGVTAPPFQESQGPEAWLSPGSTDPGLAAA
ncbi:hypothetical protein E2I00_008631, partial [Balaenoptera physalus]